MDQGLGCHTCGREASNINTETLSAVICLGGHKGACCDVDEHADASKSEQVMPVTIYA